MAPSVARTREELTEDFLDLDHRYAALSQYCTSKQLTWCPADAGWSIAQCIEHVARINSVYLIAIKTAIAEVMSAKSGDDHKAIRVKMAGLETATHHLAEVLMDHSLKEALENKKLSEIT